MNRSRAMSMRDRGRAHTERLRPRLYKLPLDLLTTILDYLNYEEILCLCEDPKFPIEILLRRHLVKEYDTPILDYIVFRDWVFPSAIKRLIALIEDWDVGNEKTDRPLVTALNVKRISLCTIFLEAGARVNFAETTVVSQEILSRYIREQGIQGPREDTITRILRLGGGRHEVVRTPLEPIHIAVFTGNLTGSSNLEIIKLLLDHGANPNAHAGLFGTPLHLTTNNAVIKLLLANGADVNARDGLGATPLFEAIRMNDFNSFATLVKAGADINVLNHQNVTPINFAIELGHSRIMNLLMDAGCDISGQSGGVPSLYVAAGLGQQVAVQSLIKKGADVAIRYDDSTALHGTEDPSTASTLLAYGADINAKDRNGTTPFMLATQSNNYRLMEVYLMADADVSPSHLQENETLSWLADNGLYHLQRLLVSRCDVRLSVEESETILRNAIHDKFEAIAFLLIETFPHLVTDEYALWEAARLSSPRLVQKIIDLRQKVEAEDRGFIDGLFGAIDLAREDVVKILPQALISPVNLGKIVNLPLFVLIVGTHDALQEIEKMSKEHPTHQWMSIRENEPTDVSIEKSLSMLQTLIDHGADISNAEYEGMGILHCAAWRNSEPLMRALLAAGANPLFKDARGYTAAYWAARLSHFEMEKILRLAEADALAKQEVEEGRSDGVEAQP